MTYQKIKESLVNEQKRMTEKEVRKLSVSLAFTFGGLFLTLALAMYAVLGFAFTVIAIILVAFMYTQTLETIVENEGAERKVRKFTKFGWVFYVLCVGVFVALKFFRFI